MVMPADNNCYDLATGAMKGRRHDVSQARESSQSLSDVGEGRNLNRHVGLRCMGRAMGSQLASTSHKAVVFWIPVNSTAAYSLFSWTSVKEADRLLIDDVHTHAHRKVVEHLPAAIDCQKFKELPLLEPDTARQISSRGSRPQTFHSTSLSISGHITRSIKTRELGCLWAFVF